MTTTDASHLEPWPSLPLEAWADTYATLHLWTQIAGKVRLSQSPWLNHTWHSTLYMTARGLTTSPIPHGLRTFQIDFDFLAHRLILQSSDGGTGGFALEPQSVAAFYARLMEELEKLKLPVDIYRLPNEVPDPVRFDQDETHRSYDPDYANRFWRILVQADRIFKEFRARFIGKCSPVHFFWGCPRPGRHAVLRTAGAGAPWRRSRPAGLDNPRRLFPRGKQLRILAGRGSGPLRRVLFLCLSGAGRLRRRAPEAGRRLLQQRSPRIHPAL